jgi:hypothetical protein
MVMTSTINGKAIIQQGRFFCRSGDTLQDSATFVVRASVNDGLSPEGFEVAFGANNEMIFAINAFEHQSKFVKNITFTIGDVGYHVLAFAEHVGRQSDGNSFYRFEYQISAG